MSEKNVLNPNSDSPLNPYYPYSEGIAEMYETFKPGNAPRYRRRMLAEGHVFELAWSRLSQLDADKLRRWARQYREDFFTLRDHERKRAYSGSFAGELKFITEGYQAVSAQGVFLEEPGLAMLEYPEDWERDAIFLEERNGQGEDLTLRVGTWTYQAQANAHGGDAELGTAGAELINAGTVSTEYVEILYYGYGFRYYSRKDSNLGKVEISLDDTVIAAGLDLYAAAAAPAAALLTKTDVKLGEHRVKARALNQKNAASSDFKVIFDAIEVMQ